MRTELCMYFILRNTSGPRVKFVNSRPGVVLILCGFVIYTTGRFMF